MTSGSMKSKSELNMNKPFASRKLQIELLSKKDGNWKMHSIPINIFA